MDFIVYFSLSVLAGCDRVKLKVFISLLRSLSFRSLCGDTVQRPPATGIAFQLLANGFSTTCPYLWCPGFFRGIIFDQTAVLQRLVSTFALHVLWVFDKIVVIPVVLPRHVSFTIQIFGKSLTSPSFSLVALHVISQPP